MVVPAIYQINILRFRRIKALSWNPGEGVNVILGGGDVGKSTLLEAISLLLSPTNFSVLSDTDYYNRNVDDGFIVEGVFRLPPDGGINDQTIHSWPWNWNGQEAVVPSVDDEENANEIPVYRLRVRGTPDLELVYEIVQPDGDADNLSVGLRRAIGLIRLASDDRHDRDLRLVQGSALDRLLSDKGLRSRLASGLAKSPVSNELSEEAKTSLANLNQVFQAKSLPHGLELAITGGHGLSVSALIGLTAIHNAVDLPLSCWGSGTRRFAALAIAEQNQAEAPIALVDEVERGLEPYRQRALMEELRAGRSQTFVTTHSPAVISAASEMSIWHIDHAGKIGLLDSRNIGRHLRNDPEAFLARLTVVAEGATECGFVTALLERALGTSLKQLGVHVLDAVGHDSAIDLLDALRSGGLSFAAFADDEGRFAVRWGSLSDYLGDLLFRWPKGCLDENIISLVGDEYLEALIADPAGEKTGSRLRTLADRLGLSDKSFATIREKAGADFRRLIVEAALGMVPPGCADPKRFIAHRRDWFKSEAGGRELAAKVFGFGLWPILGGQMLPFCNATRRAVGMPPVEDIC